MTTAAPTDVVERAKAALEGVTDGPWRTEKSKYVSGWYIVAAGNRNVIHATEWDSEMVPHDYLFAAEARVLVPELVAEIEALRAEMKRAIDEGDWA